MVSVIAKTPVPITLVNQPGPALRNAVETKFTSAWRPSIVLSMHLA
jgi:hypothetical protein